MPVTNQRARGGFLWMLPNSTVAYKLTVERADGTVDDITNFISYAEIEDNVTESIGRFSFEIANPNEDYTDIWTGNEIFRYYKDYAATATTLVFRGRLEKPSKRFYKLKVDGRSEGKYMLDVTVTKSYDNVETSVIVKDLFATYLPNITVNNVTLSSTNLTATWTNKTLFEVMQEIASKANYDFYVDADLDLHYFLKGSVLNTTDAIVHEMNLLEIGDFTPDDTLVKNRVIVYGAVIDGIQVLATADDSDSITDVGVKELIINDENITEEITAQQIADSNLANNLVAPKVGDITSWILSTVRPGETVRLSSPVDEIPPAYYNSTGYKDVLDLNSGILKTTIYINKEPRKISHLVKDRISDANKKKTTSLNPEGMRYSRNFLFDTDEGSHTNTEITDGVLKLVDGESSGYWISSALNLTNTLDEAYLILVGNTVTGAVVEVSGDSGATYQTITDKNKITLSGAKGSSLVIKVTISNTATQIDSLSILYKLD